MDARHGRGFHIALAKLNEIALEYVIQRMPLIGFPAIGRVGEAMVVWSYLTISARSRSWLLVGADHPTPLYPFESSIG